MVYCFWEKDRPTTASRLRMELARIVVVVMGDVCDREFNKAPQVEGSDGELQHNTAIAIVRRGGKYV